MEKSESSFKKRSLEIGAPRIDTSTNAPKSNKTKDLDFAIFKTGAEKLGYILVILVAFVLGISIGISPATKEKTADIKNSVTSRVSGVVGKLFPDKSDRVDDEVNFALFWNVWGTLFDKYVEKDISHQDMFYGAIKGMVSALNDPVTTFLTPNETAEYQKGNRGAFEGIGAELGYRDNQVIVVSPLEGSPALAAGLKAGDAILAVDGNSIAGKSILDVVQVIRGKAGTKVKLTVSRKGNGTEPLDISIERGKIEVASMSYVKKDTDGVGVLDLDRFTEATLTEWQSKWDGTVAKVIADDPDTLILDLRGNPGGYFSGAVYAASEFLTLGDVVVQQQDRDGEVINYTVDRTGKLRDIELVVLVNEGSASASEILAGALQKNDRAKIVGERTFGKGTAQDVIDYSDGSSLHVTVYKWLLPDGKWLNPDDPIVPDVKVGLSDTDFKEGRDPQLKKAKEMLK